MTTRLVPTTRKPQVEERKTQMTFRPTKCVVEIDGVRLWDANNGSINAWFPRRCPEKLSRVNSWAYARALIVPLVPGMEAVVRAHLAAKPKPAKKPAKKGKKT